MDHVAQLLLELGLLFGGLSLVGLLAGRLGPSSSSFERSTGLRRDVPAPPWAQPRAHDLQQLTGGIDDSITVAVLTPQPDGHRRWAPPSPRYGVT